MGYQPNAAEGSQHSNASPSPIQQPIDQPAAHQAAEVAPVVDVASLLFEPHRASRPHAIVVLVRGIPGSGKSWLAQRLRALEVENGCKAPRILSIDPFFMVEVEDENAHSRAPNSIAEKYVHDASKEGVQMLPVQYHIVCA